MTTTHLDTPRAQRADGDDAHDDDETSRLDRELIELLNELRVLLPGVQVIFGFLLTAPFTQRFTELTTLERTAFYVAFLAAALASVALIAPTAFHRLRWRRHDKERLLRIANRLAIAAVVAIAIGISAVILLVTGFVYSDSLAVPTVVAVSALVVTLWFLLPLARGRKDR